jgi:hypothetical protein
MKTSAAIAASSNKRFCRRLKLGVISYIIKLPSKKLNRRTDGKVSYMQFKKREKEVPDY